MEINVSQLTPAITSEDLQARVRDFDEHLTQWGEYNDIPIIKTDLLFKINNWRSLEVDDALILNRHGVVRLLKCFKRQYLAFKLSIQRDNKHNADETQEHRKDHSPP